MNLARHQHKSSREIELENEVKQLRIEVKQLRYQVEWINRLVSNESLSPAQKITAHALRRELVDKQDEKREEDGLTPVFMKRLADMTGQSPDTVGKCVRQLSDSGGILRKVEASKSEDGVFSKRVLLDITPDLLKNPSKFELNIPRNHGGKRSPFCKSCGSKHLTVTTIVVCKDCGDEQSRTVRDVTEPDELEIPDTDNNEVGITDERSILQFPSVVRDNRTPDISVKDDTNEQDRTDKRQR